MLTIDSGSLIELATDVWTATLGMGLHPVPPAEEGAGGLDSAAAIAIGGAWSGLVVLDCSQDFAKRMASAMFDMAEHELSDEEVDDALGELVNILGGGIKASFTQDCELGLPLLGSEAEAARTGGDRMPVMRTSFDSEGAPVRLTLLESS